MRHRRRSRRLGRSSSHRRAMLKNLASALFLTQRDRYLDEYGEEFETLEVNLPRRRLWVLDLYDNMPRTPGRIVTTIEKAKEVRPLVEKCITIALKALPHKQKSDELGENINKKDNPGQWEEWAGLRAPFVNARRRCLQLLGDRNAVDVLFDFVAPDILEQDRQGGYTRIVRLPTRRLGDAGTQAILEFVGFDPDRDRNTSEVAAVMPDFDEDVEDEDVTADSVDDSDEGDDAGDDAADESDADSVDDSDEGDDAGDDAADESGDDGDDAEPAEDESADEEASDEKKDD